MRVRVLDEDWARVVLALATLAWQDEGVEVTTHQEASMTQPAKIKTCPACGTTGAIGAVFYVSNPTYCKPCTTLRINEHIHRINEATRDTAENHRQPWSELEVEMLLSAVAEGMHAKDIAEMLGRTYLAVHGKLENIRRLLATGQAVTYVTFETTSTTTVKVTRDPNYVASAPDEDRWWEPDYYKRKEAQDGPHDLDEQPDAGEASPPGMQ